MAAGQEMTNMLGGAEIADHVLEESDEGLGPERLDGDQPGDAPGRRG